MEENVSNLPVMPKCCKTCPFKNNEKGFWQDTELANKVIERNLFKSQQICHHPRLKGEEETNRCRGFFDYAFEIYERLGMNPKENLINNPK